MGLASPKHTFIKSDSFVSRPIPSALITFDVTGRIVHCNNWALAVMGLNSEEVIGADIQAFLKRILHANDFKKAQKWIDNPRSLDSRLMYVFNGWGEKVPLEISINSVPGVESVVVARDVFAYTAWQKQNQRINRMRLISDLAEETADKVMNPLTSLKGFIQLYQNNREEFPWDVLVQELDNIERAVQEVLVFSHNYMGKPERIAINQMIYEVYTSVEYAAQQRGIWTELYLEDKLGNIKANPRKIRTLLSNLILYSLNNTGSGGILTIETHKTRDLITIELVSGMHDRTKQQEEEYPKSLNLGDNDLNLVICEHIVDSLGGNIHIKSREKAETIVIVTIPRQAN
ncbi:MAG: PAS domain S-box protein [Ignavibacteriales bacterium]